MRFIFDATDTDQDTLQEALVEFDIREFTITVCDKITLDVPVSDFDETLEMLDLCQFEYEVEE